MYRSTFSPVRRRRREVRQPRGAQKGITTVEAAIVFGVFLLFLIAILDGARMIYAYGVMSHAAREGVRYAVVRGAEAGQDARRAADSPTTANQVETHVQNRAMPLESIQVFVTWPVDDEGQPEKDPGKVVEVRVEHDFEPVTPFFIPASPIRLTSTSRMVIYF